MLRHVLRPLRMAARAAPQILAGSRAAGSLRRLALPVSLSIGVSVASFSLTLAACEATKGITTEKTTGIDFPETVASSDMVYNLIGLGCR